jgi:hypothetical protein
MATIWKNFQAWLESKGGSAHVAAGVWVGLVAAYAAVPPFTSLVNTVYGATPSWLHQTLAAITGLIAWYKDTQSRTAKAQAAEPQAQAGKAV